MKMIIIFLLMIIMKNFEINSSNVLIKYDFLFMINMKIKFSRSKTLSNMFVIDSFISCEKIWCKGLFYF